MALGGHPDVCGHGSAASASLCTGWQRRGGPGRGLAHRRHPTTGSGLLRSFRGCWGTGEASALGCTSGRYPLASTATLAGGVSRSTTVSFGKGTGWRYPAQGPRAQVVPGTQAHPPVRAQHRAIGQVAGARVRDAAFHQQLRPSLNGAVAMNLIFANDAATRKRRHAVRRSRRERGHLHQWKMASELVGDTGFEPVTSSVSTRSITWRDLLGCCSSRSRRLCLPPLPSLRSR
jgi:hypothetical protein